MERFPFETLNAIVGGRSAIDNRGLQVEDLEAAEAFLECYGFRWDHPEERAEVETIRLQALAFIDEVLLEPHEHVPAGLRAESDVRRLLMAVSQDTPAPWACGLLRVMHTLAHATSDFRDTYAPQVEEQIVGRFERWLTRDGDRVSLGDIELVDVQVRARKELRSMVLKLLHKPENVAAAIFDRIGLRFVTRDRLDALRVVRFLRERSVFMFANVKPSRSRNTLVDLERLEALMETETDRDRIAAEVERWEEPHSPGEPVNPFSSRAYRSIQFTARQRITVEDAHGERLRFFFPFEIQILDQRSLEEAQAGFASHAEYKERQRQAARERVLGDALRSR